MNFCKGDKILQFCAAGTTVVSCIVVPQCCVCSLSLWHWWREGRRSGPCQLTPRKQVCLLPLNYCSCASVQWTHFGIEVYGNVVCRSSVRTVWGNLSEKWLLKCSKRNLLRQCLVWFLVFSLFEVAELSSYTARFINRVMVYANEGHAHNTGLRTHKMKMLVVGLHGTGLASGMVWHSSLRLKTLGQRWFHTSWDHYTTLQWTVIHCASSAFVWVSSSSAFLCPLQDDNRTNRFYRAPALKFYFFPPSSCLHFPAFSRIENSLILSFFCCSSLAL